MHKTTMGNGYIKIEENVRHEFSVEARLVNGTLWLSKWQMASLFNVYTKTIEGCLNAIFKAGLLQENDVSRIQTFEHAGRTNEQILYNLDTLIFVGFSIASFEAKAFREWVLKAFSEYMKNDRMQTIGNALIVWNIHLQVPVITSLN